MLIPNFTQMPDAHTEGRRHLRLRIPAQVSGVDLCGRNFVEPAHTLVVTPSGAIIECVCALAPDMEVCVSVNQKEMTARVLGQAGPPEAKYIYAISFTDPDPSFWGVNFAATQNEICRPAATIECSHCAIQRKYSLNEIEWLIASAGRSFGLYCPGCKDTALWKLATFTGLGEAIPYEGRPAAQPTDTRATDEQVALATVGSARKNRAEGRKYRRVYISRSKACVLLPNQEQEIVDLLNVSRGGASFRSGKVYSVGCSIQIAAPTIMGAHNIFVLGKVVRVMYTESGLEYGVEYITSEC